jgi:serine/threonine-protein kinase
VALAYDPIPTAGPAPRLVGGKAGGRTLPQRLGRYTLFDHIGRGGMADIYLAKARTGLGGSRLVVVKEVLPHLAADERFAEMLVAEAKIAARVTHANVVKTDDLGREQGVLYIAMEYVEGFDLRELLRRCARDKVPLPVEFSLLVLIEALRGLDYAHRLTNEAGEPLGLVHRDVSPSNVLISFEGEVKLCDFGIARANEVAAALPEDTIQGKAGYMSPEHAKGDPIDARADVFAAGIVLWELLAGRRLYKVGKAAAAEGGEALLELARRADVPPLPARGLPEEAMIHAIAERALRVDRDARYPSAAAMLRDLEQYAGRARMIASPLRFGEWLTERFGKDIVEARRGRERALRAIEMGPVAVIVPIEPAKPRFVDEPTFDESSMTEALRLENAAALRAIAEARGEGEAAVPEPAADAAITPDPKPLADDEPSRRRRRGPSTPRPPRARRALRSLLAARSPAPPAAPSTPAPALAPPKRAVPGWIAVALVVAATVGFVVAHFAR